MDINNSIFPEKIVRTTGSNGTSFTSQVYSFENWGNLSLISLFYFLAVLSVIAPLASGLLLLFYALSIDRIPTFCSHNFFGGIVALYLLIDIHKGWIFSELIDVFTEPHEFNRVINFQLALLIIHTLLFFGGGVVYNLCLRSKFLSFLLIGAMLYLSYYISIFLIANHIVKI
jgi:hypothetical protein